MSKPNREIEPAAPQPQETDKSRQAEAARHQREAAALRENLAKRKAQQRSRRGPASADKG